MVKSVTQLGTFTQTTTSSGSAGLGFTYSTGTSDYTTNVAPYSGEISQVLGVMMQAGPPTNSFGFQTTGPASGLVGGGNIEPSVAFGETGSQHINGPVIIDNNLEGALSVDDWNIIFNQTPKTNIYGLVKNLLKNTLWDAAGSLNPVVHGCIYNGTDRREIKLGKASLYYSAFVSGLIQPRGTGSAGSTMGQVFYNPAFFEGNSQNETASNPSMVTVLPLVVSQNGIINASNVIGQGGNLEPYAQWITWQWMIGNTTTALNAANAVTAAWTNFTSGTNGTATFGQYGNSTRDLCHYVSMMRATGFYSANQATVTQVLKALASLIDNSASGLPQQYTCNNGLMPSTTKAKGQTAEPNMQYLLCTNPYATNITGGWFH